MIWYLIIGYVVLSQILVVGLWAYSFFGAACPQAEQLKQSDKGNQFWTTAILLLLGFLLAPILAPVFLYFWYRCSQEVGEEIEYWNTVLKNHYELRLDPLHNDNIGDELRAYLDEHSAAPLAEDYQLIGDFWMKDEPFNSKARIFLHQHGETFVEIGNTLENDYCETLSFLDDGSVVSTANCGPLDIQVELAENGYHVECHPGMSLDEMINKHEELLASIQQQTGTDRDHIPAGRG